MTEVREAVREGNAAETAAAPPDAQSAQARDSLAQPSSVALDAVTQSARAARRAVALLDRPGSLPDAQPPTFRQARDWHHRCAGHYQAGLIRWPRLAWAYLHLLLVKPALNLAEWVTASPARAFVAAAVLAAAWYWRP